jgi:hypothetical protein
MAGRERAKKTGRRARRIVPVGAALTLILFSYPSCAAGVAALLSESRTASEVVLGVAALALGVALLAAGAAALPAASRLVVPGALVLAGFAAAAVCAAAVAFWRSPGDDRVAAVALGAFAAAALVAALLLLRVARKVRVQ